MIRCKYSGPGLVQGERARVRYVEYDGGAARTGYVDQGGDGAWHLRESSGENGYWAWVAMGVVCGFVAYRQLMSARQPQTGA